MFGKSEPASRCSAAADSVLYSYMWFTRSTSAVVSARKTALNPPFGRRRSASTRHSGERS